jgi:hypothetical protein
MRPVDSIQDWLGQMSSEEFIAAYPAPVLVSFRHLEGDLRQNPQVRYSSSTGAPVNQTMFLVRPRAGADEGEDAYELEVPRFDWVAGGETHELHETITIGRFIDSVITVTDYTVSADHAWLLIDNVEGAYFVVDRGSTNGTFINGSRLRPHLIYEIESEQELVCGRVVFRFVDSECFYKMANGYFDAVSVRPGHPVPSS